MTEDTAAVEPDALDEGVTHLLALAWKQGYYAARDQYRYPELDTPINPYERQETSA